jgi:chromosome segregation ATPase
MAAKITDLERANQLAADLAAAVIRADTAETELATARENGDRLAADVTAATDERNTAQAEVERLTGELATRDGTITAHAARITELEGAIKNPSRQAAQILAKVGANTVPGKPNGNAVGTTLEEISAAFRAETDSEKRHVLASQLRTLRAKQKEPARN